MKSSPAKLAYGKAYYADHKEERRAYDADHKEERRAYWAAYDAARKEGRRQEQAEFTSWLQILRTNNGCEDCGTHEGALDHHHIDPTTKLHQVSEMYSYSLDALEDELDKCVVLCRPCHGRRHVEMESIAA